jgi:5-oxopent-3-ene-1,2,5-tricarboxylate decarboxylase / 2-hydroxyhepta-2,4-diene-1,7-dioate isomerase
MPATLPGFDFAPFGLSGVVVGALLNHPPQLAALGAAIDAAPYKGAPRAPVLQVKPRNTFAGDGDTVAVPAGVAALEMGLSLAIIIGRPACRVAVQDALACVAGYTLANDISVPVHSHYRPALQARARDGFCPIGPLVVPAAALVAPDALATEVWVDGELVRRGHTGGRVRGVAQLHIGGIGSLHSRLVAEA